jgi:hypothetical protein
MAGNRDDGHGADRDRDSRDRDLRIWDREMGGYGGWNRGAPDSQPQPGPPPSHRTKVVYFAMMGTCLGLCAIAWVVVARYSTLAAVIMSAAALVIPPFASIIANAASATDRHR